MLLAGNKRGFKVSSIRPKNEGEKILTTTKKLNKFEYRRRNCREPKSNCLSLCLFACLSVRLTALLPSRIINVVKIAYEPQEAIRQKVAKQSMYICICTLTC